MEAGAELDERGDAAVDRDRAFVGPRDAGDALEQRRLARSVAADDAVGAALRHAEGHAAQRRERLVRLQIADQAALEQRRLERRELLLPRVAAVDLRDVDDVDGGFMSRLAGSPLAAHAAARARLQRSRCRVARCAGGSVDVSFVTPEAERLRQPTRFLQPRAQRAAHLQRDAASDCTYTSSAKLSLSRSNTK